MSNITQSKPKKKPANDAASVSFAALRPRIERNIVLPTETVTSDGDRVKWGDGNAYPDYLLSLYEDVTDLAAVINGTVDYVGGDDVTIDPSAFPTGKVNHDGDEPRDLVRDLARDYLLYGGFAVLVIRNALGEVAELYYVDLRFLRSNSENTVFYYSEKWGDRSSNKKEITYPAYMPDLTWADLDEKARNEHAASIVFYKLNKSHVYPRPIYGPAVKACEAERAIDEYHLNAVENSFVASAIVNFNNGIPSDDVKAEIERTFTEKFSGSSNAGRVLFSWNPDKDSATTIDYPKVEDFGEKYNALAKNSRQRIFTAFRANPNLFGIPTESLGFSSEEYDTAFRLFNRTMVQPIQKTIADILAYIFGRDVLTIFPFTLDGAGEGAVE